MPNEKNIKESPSTTTFTAPPKAWRPNPSCRFVKPNIKHERKHFLSYSHEDTAGSACSYGGQPQNCRTSPQRRAGWPVLCTAGRTQSARTAWRMLCCLCCGTINHLAPALSQLTKANKYTLPCIPLDNTMIGLSLIPVILPVTKLELEWKFLLFFFCKKKKHLFLFKPILTDNLRAVSFGTIFGPKEVVRVKTLKVSED